MSFFEDTSPTSSGTDASDMRARDSQQSAPFREAYEQGVGDAQAAARGGSRSVTSSIPNAARKTVGLMAIAVIFSLAGYELKKSQNKSGPGPQPVGGLTGGAKIILGGTIATAILAAAAQAGTNGQQFAVGVATVTVVASVFVSGGPVWHGIQNLFGSTGSSGSTGSTGQPDISRQAAPNYMGPLPSIQTTNPTGATGR